MTDSPPVTPPSPLVSFLTDFGLMDSYVGQVKAVMLGICPGLQIVDLTHEVPAQDVFEGAFQLMEAVSSFPPGSIHLAVVDPGVGTARRGLAVRLGAHVFVGPDNGVFTLALRCLASNAGERLREDGDYVLAEQTLEAIALAEPRFWRHPVAPTFHARDVFGPVVAHLASGTPLEALGPSISRIFAIPFPETVIQADGSLRGQVVRVDRFGNLTTNVSADRLPASSAISLGGISIRGLQPTYGSSRAPVALIGSSGYLEVAIPGDSAAHVLGLGRGAEVVVRTL